MAILVIPTMLTMYRQCMLCNEIAQMIQLGYLGNQLAMVFAGRFGVGKESPRPGIARWHIPWITQLAVVLVVIGNICFDQAIASNSRALLQGFLWM